MSPSSLKIPCTMSMISVSEKRRSQKRRSSSLGGLRFPWFRHRLQVWGLRLALRSEMTRVLPHPGHTKSRLGVRASIANCWILVKVSDGLAAAGQDAVPT